MIRLFTADDAPEVAEMIAETLRQVNSRDYPQEYIEGQIRDFTPDFLIERATWTHFYVDVQDGRIVACGAVGPYFGMEDEACLFNMFVRPDCQGRGLGRAMLRTLERDDYFTRARRAEVPASITSCGFYRRMGYNFKDGGQELDESLLYRLEKYKED